MSEHAPRLRSNHEKSWKFPWLRISLGIFGTIVCCLVAASIGSVGINPNSTLLIALSRVPMIDISQTWPDSWDTILWKLRFPRIILAFIVGASLSVSSATFQGLFRNPLADPYLIGVASGASLGATVVFLTGIPFIYGGISILPIASFTGGLIAVFVAYGIAVRSSSTRLTTLILAGVAIGSFTTAISSLLMLRSDPDLRVVLSWIMGGFIKAQWNHSLFLIPYLLPGFILTFAYSRILNTMQLDEEYASSLGVNIERTKKILILVATMMTAAVVSFSGLIGFVGLVAPHIVRLIWDSDFRTLIPMAAIVGGCFLVIADLIARTILSPGEIPVGIVTALCGAPFFIYLLLRNRQNTT